MERVDPQKVVCPQLPGNYSVHCNNRHLRVYWIPPEGDNFSRAVPTFRELNSSRFTSFPDQLKLPGAQGRHYDHNGTRPNTIYEFGLNHVTDEGVVVIPPPHGNQDFPRCLCTSPPDVPDTPTDFSCHYLHENNYSCEWTPGGDYGSPVEVFKLQYKENNTSDQNSNKWIYLTEVPGSVSKVNVTLQIRTPTEVRLNAINTIGESATTSGLVKPPLYGHSDTSWMLTNAFTYTAATLGIILFLILLAAIFIFKRRQGSFKGRKHPFLINFTQARGGRIRLLNGSLQDTSLAATKTTTLSGPPFEFMSTFEPAWSQEVNSLYGATTGISSESAELQCSSMIIPSSKLRFLRYIGCGAFGKVWEGRINVTTDSTGKGDQFKQVALKVRNVNSLTEAEFKREAALMQRYQHNNIVRFYGISLDSPHHQCLVLEMMEQGNLREYLHRARPRLTPSQAEEFSRQEHTARSDRSSRQTETTEATAGESACSGSAGVELHAVLTIADLLRIMRDIAGGCRYLEEQHFVHRDIAARNCLVSHNHESGRIVKLCDFGLARDIYKNDYYRKRNEPKLPVRWMSPEAILEGLFTSKSDIWAYAVTCWEVMSLGADPFFGQVNLDVINLVLNGNVLSKPENCPSLLYDHMLQCWSRFPETRPTFADVCKTMDEFVEASKDSQSPFSGPFAYRVPIGGSTVPSQSTPTVGDIDWHQKIGCTVSNRNVAESAVNLIHSNSPSLNRMASSKLSSRCMTSKLHRHASFPRPSDSREGQSDNEFYYNRPQHPSHPQSLYLQGVRNSGGRVPLPRPSGLRRQHSDHYQYSRQCCEVDSMGYERPALVLEEPYFNTFQQGLMQRPPTSPSRYLPQSPPPPPPPHYTIPTRPPFPRDANYGTMHHSLYVGGGISPAMNNLTTNQTHPNANMTQSAHFGISTTQTCGGPFP